MLRYLTHTPKPPKQPLYTLTRSLPPRRPLHSNPGPEDRQSLHPEHSEYTKSGTDDAVAHHLSSYDPSTTTPELESRVLEEECKLLGEADPLFISPANRNVSLLLEDKPGVAMQAFERMVPSARGWTRKHKEVRIRQMGEPELDQFWRLLRGLREVQARRVVRKEAGV
ncbi:uncharacterized protein ACLA_062440 [Aspergillus clavatus NRRL 1]|uniref:Uncharacterized protein n=1 Tax=Aspergillus clavatus (strain ATCC 1007 / CBS 513.65 / DSM 816 / NCTC 3887 / NRRL 1 / QM 1276 / 107) TaxID=344612 RepID=A1CCM3_ASPCL|nr:uncharacterized protein ACLA_062440 [Aspergillus clavatus NRRL 1]EAW12280.1 conserved hypothetical protein [Aspergillus clavatus NRRL 1]